jgi:DNA-directed RNA polymerase specialized sigma24 family protein
VSGAARRQACASGGQSLAGLPHVRPLQPSVSKTPALPGEVLEAIRGLGDADYIRLRHCARAVLRGTAFSSAEDLLVHVLGTAYLAAHQRGGEGRRWTRDVNFMAYLVMTLRGVASDSRRSARRRREIGSGHGPDLANSLQFAAPPPEQALLEEEDCQFAARRSVALDQVAAHFKDDEQVRWVIHGIKDGRPARQIQKESGMTKIQYDSAQRRWRRGLDDLFPGRKR